MPSATFRCPVCKRNHVVQQGDDMDYICDNSLSQIKLFQNMENTSPTEPAKILTQNNWNFNQFSTKKDVYRDATIINPKASQLIHGRDSQMGGGRAAKNW